MCYHTSRVLGSRFRGSLYSLASLTSDSGGFPMQPAILLLNPTGRHFNNLLALCDQVRRMSNVIDLALSVMLAAQHASLR
ncbi:hypothetical protein D7S89_20130 [Trinickia fusca]|uniref:Uncharacterized protein n=1 Tax=Trinickia fusca TaxID=2419777 RepID=A0A494X373_9BURK|nr:hypothetical protein D7S89_20130 [Trinickia fusca]